MNRRFFYSIEGFEPPRQGNVQPGGFGFIVYLDKEFAKKAFERSLPENSPLMNIGREIIRGYGSNIPDYFEPYLFVRNENTLTSLVHSLDVPGDACGLDLCDSTIKQSLYNDEDNWVQYSPHNVDSKSQASVLLSLFTKWANTMTSVLDLKFKR